MDTQHRLLVDMVRLHMMGRAFCVPEQVDWMAFARLAGSHGLSAMVFAERPYC